MQYKYNFSYLKEISRTAKRTIRKTRTRWTIPEIATEFTSFKYVELDEPIERARYSICL